MKHREIYLLLISSFVLVIFWIAFSIYHNSVTSTIPPKLNIQIIPIKPDFNTKAVNDIKTRTEAAPLYQIEKTSDVFLPTPATMSSTPAATSEGSLIP